MLVDPGPLRRHAGFRRLWLGQLASQVGNQLTVVAVGYQTYRITGSTAMVGLVSLGQLVTLLVGSLAGGPFVDAWDRRRVLLCTQLLLAAGSVGLAVNAMLGHPVLWPMFACTAWSSTFQGVDWSARRASLRRLVPPSELAAALAVQSAGFQVTLVAGPAASGLLIAHAGFALVYWINVVTFGLALTAVLGLPPLPPAGGGRPAGLASLAGGVRYMRSSRPLAGAFLIDVGAMVFGMPRALFPALTASVYGGGAATVGYLNAAPGLGALAGSLFTGHASRVRRAGRWVTVCVGLWGAAITGFGLVPWLPAALALLVVAGAADVVSSVFRMLIVQQVTPDEVQGRVNSLLFAGLQGGPRLGDAESGVVAELAGPQFAAWSGGLLSIVTAAVTCWAIPQFWHFRSAPGDKWGTGTAEADSGAGRPDGQKAQVVPDGVDAQPAPDGAVAPDGADAHAAPDGRVAPDAGDPRAVPDGRVAPDGVDAQAVPSPRVSRLRRASRPPSPPRRPR
jgi:MFS family permease